VEILEQIAGVIKSIRFTNEKSGYTVCDLAAGKTSITLVGTMPLPVVGENVIVTGSFVEHKDYGRQFKVESYTRSRPAREDEMLSYLSSGFIKGLGPATAKKIIDTFRENTFHILADEPLRLSEIKGITPLKALFYGQAFSEHEKMRDVVMFLQKYGLPPGVAVKVWKRFGSLAEDEIKNNPYVLTEDGIDLSFPVCDRIALDLGIEPHSKARIKCALLYLLKSSVSKGHCYELKADLIKRGAKLTKISPELISHAFDELLPECEVCVDTKFPDRVYTYDLFEAEHYCALKLKALNTERKDYLPKDIDELLHQYELTRKIMLDNIQKEAVKSAFTKGISIITGGPGTGKTTIIEALIYCFEAKGFSVTLAAPTGRAAKRISETSGYEAKTIHRLLEVGYDPEQDDKPYFMRNEDNPLSADVVIIDEASMIDVILMRALLAALPKECRLILVGDDDQLPPVGPGKILSDIIESKRFNSVKLKTIFRQSEESLIITNAHLINQGIIPSINNIEGEFFFIPKHNIHSVCEAVADLCLNQIPQNFNLDPILDIQVLSPIRKGEAGVDNLNMLLQQSLNPGHKDKPQKVYGNVVFRVGDRVMQIKNDYTLSWNIYDRNGRCYEGQGVYNGDIGIISDIDIKEELLTVCFDDNRICEYKFDQLDNLEHAYAITVHKSQGTEFPAVVIPLFNVPHVMIRRNLLYTAVTRAKKLVVLVGSTAVFENMIKNANQKDRRSGLKERLNETGFM
jgi:exodeoxyribonuclease V alpha subunit